MATRTTAKPTRGSSYRCAECGWAAPKWVGRCGECQAWGSVVEVGAPRARELTAGAVTAPARPITEVDGSAARHCPTGIAEFDRVLGGGLVPGSVVLLAGEPGVGKSTLLLAASAASALAGNRVLYVSGEESAEQVRSRAGRIGALAETLYLASETDLGAVLGQVEAVEPDLLVLDSVQTVAMPGVEGTAGGVAQVREVTGALVRVAKSRGLTVLLVGHVTKEGTVAGPRTLEHLVDVVLQFEGERQSRLRLVRAAKNRFGPADEVGCFDLTEDGIVGLADPSGLFLSRGPAAPGTAVTVAMEGRRPLLAEVQALVAASPLAAPRRNSSGLDAARVAMTLAVLERRCGVRLAQQDVFTASVGGVRLTEPATDLALALAVAGAAVGRSGPDRLVAIGEVGLAGDLRPVPALPQRLAEAARLGFESAIVPEGDPVAVPAGMRLHPVADLAGALRALKITSAR